MATIHIIMTGGTIDSVWDAKQDMVVVAEHSIVPDYFASKKMDNLIFTEICMKDSRGLTSEDLTNLLNTIEKSKSSKIIITHGTYTMPDTAKYLQDNLKRKDQVIILTGAMTPLKGFADSDGAPNLDLTVAKLTSLTPGIYFCLNAQIFTPEEVAKNIAEGKFYSVFRNEQ